VTWVFLKFGRVEQSLSQFVGGERAGSTWRGAPTQEVADDVGQVGRHDKVPAVVQAVREELWVVSQGEGEREK
jgi:hypothetical protein